MSRTINDLSKLSDEDLIREHDAKAEHTSVGTQYYVDELYRRSQHRSEELSRNLAIKSQKLATRTYIQSWISAGASLIAVVISVIALFIR